MQFLSTLLSAKKDSGELARAKRKRLRNKVQRKEKLKKKARKA